MPIDPFLGQIIPFAGQVVPRGWARCEGQLMAINQNTALFSLLGTYFGGNGVNTFGLPDLRGRAILGANPDGSPVLGEIGGSTMVNLTTPQLPSHNHMVQVSTTSGTGRFVTPAGHIFATNTEPSSNPNKIFVTAGSHETNLTVSTNLTNDGGGAPHNNMQPYLAISYLIALTGIYPSRN